MRQTFSDRWDGVGPRFAAAVRFGTSEGYGAKYRARSVGVSRAVCYRCILRSNRKLVPFDGGGVAELGSALLIVESSALHRLPARLQIA